ncbi:MAG: UDP-N-acetylglucosamine 2-epimerase [Candidatus Hermodarchaeota archaeon]
MPNILIINNLFNFEFEYIPKIVKNFLTFYKQNKLKRLLRLLKKSYKEDDLNVQVIDVKTDNYDIDKFIANYRLNLDRKEYLGLFDKVLDSTRKNLFVLNKNLDLVNALRFEEIQIEKVLELNFIQFFNHVFGNFEILKKIIQNGNYDKVILINHNCHSIDLLSSLNNLRNNIEIIQDKFLRKIYNKLKWLNIIEYVLSVILVFIKNKLFKSFKESDNKRENNSQNIIFIGQTKTQIESISPVYDLLKKQDKINPIFYLPEYYISFSQISNLIRHLLNQRKLLNIYHKNICHLLKYDSIKLDNLIKIFYQFNLYIFLIKIYNVRNNLADLFRKFIPLLVVVPSDFSLVGRVSALFSKSNNVPSIFIPHGALPIYDEMIFTYDFSVLAVPGEREKEFLISKGVDSNKIVVIGRPRYEDFYKGRLKNLKEVPDMFTGKAYKFEKDKITVLLASSPVGRYSKQKKIISVVNALNNLGLLNNLLIKLHPREDGIIVKHILKKLNVESTIIRDYNILDLINSSDIILSRNSTAVLEAMILGKPVILLEFINYNFEFSGKYLFKDDNYLINISDEKLLKDSIYKLFHDKEYYNEYSEGLKNLSKGYNSFDNKESAAEKAANLIRRIIKDKKGN